MTDKKDLEIVGGRNMDLGHFWVQLPTEKVDNMTRKDYEQLKEQVDDKIRTYRIVLIEQMKTDLKNLFRGYDLDFHTP